MIDRKQHISVLIKQLKLERDLSEWIAKVQGNRWALFFYMIRHPLRAGRFYNAFNKAFPK